MTIKPNVKSSGNRSNGAIIVGGPTPPVVKLNQMQPHQILLRVRWSHIIWTMRTDWTRTPRLVQARMSQGLFSSTNLPLKISLPIMIIAAVVIWSTVVECYALNITNLLGECMKFQRAVYAGSFDPFTNGHFDIAFRGMTLFDELVIAVGENPQKNYTLTLDQRMAIIEPWLRQLESWRSCSSDLFPSSCGVLSSDRCEYHS